MEKVGRFEERIAESPVHIWMNENDFTVEDYLDINNLPSHLTHVVNEMILFRQTIASLCDFKKLSPDSNKDIRLEEHSFRLLLPGLYKDNNVDDTSLQVELADGINNLYLQWYLDTEI